VLFLVVFTHCENLPKHDLSHTFIPISGKKSHLTKVDFWRKSHLTNHEFSESYFWSKVNLTNCYLVNLNTTIFSKRMSGSFLFTLLVLSSYLSLHPLNDLFCYLSKIATFLNSPFCTKESVILWHIFFINPYVYH